MANKAMPQLTPGSKLYKCLEHDKVICKGKDETFLIEIKRISEERYQQLIEEDGSISLGPRAG